MLIVVVEIDFFKTMTRYKSFAFASSVEKSIKDIFCRNEYGSVLYVSISRQIG